MGIFRSVIEWFSQTEKTENKFQWNSPVLKSSKIDETSRIRIAAPEQQYIIKLDGKYYVFGSKEEMPESLRKGVEFVENSESGVSTYTVIRKGERETFTDLSEMPDSIRKRFLQGKENRA